MDNSDIAGVIIGVIFCIVAVFLMARNRDRWAKEAAEMREAEKREAAWAEWEKMKRGEEKREAELETPEELLRQIRDNTAKAANLLLALIWGLAGVIGCLIASNYKP